MKRLFSPWRSQYIATFKHKTKSKGCLFCAMAKSRDDDKHLILARRKYCFVVMNLYPYNSGHLMIVPYRHTKLVGRLTKNESSEIMETTADMIDALTRVVKPQGFNFGANFGRTAGAGIDTHIHFHVVPRWNGDTNFMPVLADVKMISEEIRTTYRKLKQSLKQS